MKNDGAVDGGITKVDGTHEFREPVGEYTVVAYLRTTYLLTDINQKVTKTFNVPGETVIVSFTEFPPPFTPRTESEPESENDVYDLSFRAKLG